MPTVIKTMNAKLASLLVGAAAGLLSGCVTGEATIRISAEDVRRVLNGEVVKVAVHAEVEISTPVPSDEIQGKKEKCEVCNEHSMAVTNLVPTIDGQIRAATRVMTLLLANDFCATGGAKFVGTNFVQWATLDDKYLFGNEKAMRAASNQVARCNGYVVLRDNGELDIHSGSGERVELTRDVLKTVADGCKSCRDMYKSVAEILTVTGYDNVSVVFEGDGRSGFHVESDGKSVAADQIGKELRCIIRSEYSYKKNKDKNIIKLRKD